MNSESATKVAVDFFALLMLASALFSGCATADRQMDSVTVVERIRQVEKRVEKLEESHALLRKSQLRRQYESRMKRDYQNFTQEDLKDIERLYKGSSKQWGSVDHKTDLKLLVEKYPKANRAGCAMLYLGQMAEGEERVKWYRRAISECSDCWYGDGVQVGAYALFYLGHDSIEAGNTEGARKIFEQLKDEFPEAVDHSGNLLSGKISTLLSHVEVR